MGRHCWFVARFGLQQHVGSVPVLCACMCGCARGYVRYRLWRARALAVRLTWCRVRVYYIHVGMSLGRRAARKFVTPLIGAALLGCW